MTSLRNWSVRLREGHRMAVMWLHDGTGVAIAVHCNVRTGF